MCSRLKSWDEVLHDVQDWSPIKTIDVLRFEAVQLFRHWPRGMRGFCLLHASRSVPEKLPTTWHILKQSHVNSGMESHEYHEPNQLTGEGLLLSTHWAGEGCSRISGISSHALFTLSTISTHHLKVFGLQASLLSICSANSTMYGCISVPVSRCSCQIFLPLALSDRDARNLERS